MTGPTRTQISEILCLSSVEEGALDTLVIDSFHVLILGLYKCYQSSVVPLSLLVNLVFPA